MSDQLSGKPVRNRADLILNERKLLAEVEKLEAEGRYLQRPLSRPSAWVPIVVAVISVASLVLQWKTSSLREEQAAFEAQRQLSEVQSQLSQVDQQLREYRIRLLRSVTDNLDQTSTAVGEYSPENWQQVVTLRDGNRAVEELLTLMLNVGLLPPSLTDDLENLRDHYAEWLAEFTRRFPDGIPMPHDRLVFVGSFPSKSEASIRRCLTDLEAGEAESVS